MELKYYKDTGKNGAGESCLWDAGDGLDSEAMRHVFLPELSLSSWMQEDGKGKGKEEKTCLTTPSVVFDKVTKILQRLLYFC